MSSAGGRELAVDSGSSGPYTPVSGLAVASLLVSGVAAVVIAAMGIGARVSGKPSTEPLLIVPAIVGLILAVAARWRIGRARAREPA